MRVRLGLSESTDLDVFLREMKFKSIMVFSNPFMYETHMQIMSDALITKNGIIGTIRDPNDT